MATRDELVVTLAGRDASSSRKHRGRILDEFVAVSGFHRKHAMRLLRAGQATSPFVSVANTEARHAGKNSCCTQIGSDWFAWLGTRASKCRLNFLDLLHAGQSLAGGGTPIKSRQRSPPGCPAVSLKRQAVAVAIAVCAFVAVTLDQAAGQRPLEEATLACGGAATRAEHDWQLPSGLLAAIGIVESGRRGPDGMLPIIWPWTINAEGHSFYQPSKIAAVGMVRSLQMRGVKMIDVGCFQVDLFYHPHAFASLEEAFDPDTNARAAARILSSGRLASRGWEGAIGAYHSVSPIFGTAYRQKVGAVWPWVRSHRFQAPSDPPQAFAVLLSPQALLVQVVTPSAPTPEPSLGRTRAMLTMTQTRSHQMDDIIQWLHPPEANLPRVLTPSDNRSWSLAR